jgi:hypothetical protein
MINCRNCIHWVDESLEEIEADPQGFPHLFMGCRIYGFLENNAALPSCDHYRVSENLFTICSGCGLTVPKVCVSLAQCANCTDTDLFCLDRCIGGDSRKYCPHFIRLGTEGAHLIANDLVYEVFPALPMPGQEKKSPDRAETSPREDGPGEPPETQNE